MNELIQKLREIEAFLNDVKPYKIMGHVITPFDRGDSAGRMSVALTLAAEAIRIARLTAIESVAMGAAEEA